MKTFFTEAEREILREAQAAGLPQAIDLLGQAKSANYKGATIGRIPNAFVVYTIAKDGTKAEVARYYFQDDKPRAKRHAKWDAESTLKSLKRTLGLAEGSHDAQGG